MELDKSYHNFCGTKVTAKSIMRIAHKNNYFDYIWPNRSKHAK